MNKNRPVNLDIGSIRLPITSYVSILHRISGVVMLAGVLLLLWLLDKSLSSEAAFEEIKSMGYSTICKLVLWAVLSAFIYHLVAGIRHLIMDLGVGESLEGGKRGAKIVLVISIILILLTGVCIW